MPSQPDCVAGRDGFTSPFFRDIVALEDGKENYRRRDDDAGTIGTSNKTLPRGRLSEDREGAGGAQRLW